MSDVTITVRIAEELQRQVQAVADSRGKSISEIVSSVLEDFVKTTDQVNEEAALALKTDPLLSLRFTASHDDVAGRAKEILREDSDPRTGFSLDNDRAH